MFRYLGGVVFTVLICAACTSGGETADGVDSGPTEPASVTETTTETTETTTAANDLATVLGIEPPSTTISLDADEQAAANVVYFDYWVDDECRSTLAVCDIPELAETRTQPYYESTSIKYNKAREIGLTTVRGEWPSELTIMAARQSESSDHVLGVLFCQRNYRIVYNADGSVQDDSTTAILRLSRVKLTDDGQWRIDGRLDVDEFQPETNGGNQCSKYEGAEYPDELAKEFLQ